jgi:tetratricopeptide (TPR) repeat protein
MWSEHRKVYNELYNQYKEKKEDAALKILLQKQINDFIAIDHKYGLIIRVAESDNTTEKQMELFNIRQDVIEYRTPLRTIRLKYEKGIPFNDFENHLIERYIALHKHAPSITKKAKELRKTIKNLLPLLEPLWKQYPILKEKSEKAANRIFMPPPAMKGAYSQTAFKVPTQEEMQKAHDDFMEYSNNFHRQVTEMSERVDEVHEEEKWAEEFFDESQGDYTDPMFKEVDEILGKKFEKTCHSLDTLSLDNDEQEFLEAWGEVMDEVSGVSDEWNSFLEKHNLLINTYSNFVKYVNGTYDEDEDIEVLDLSKPAKDDSPEDEGDDLRAETIKRYKSDLEQKTNTYFDTADWHIILDHYEQNFDNKNRELAMKRAFEQHPDDATMLIRKAGMLSEDHQYQKALELLKQAEAQGPPHHPKLFFVKARLFRNLQSPDLAIPLYKRLLNEQTKLPAEWRRDAAENLIEIYADSKNYEECLRLSLELMEDYHGDELVIDNVAYYYNLTGKTDEAINLVTGYLVNHPKSARCYERLGHLYFEKKDYRKAAENYDKAFITDRDEYYRARYHKGKALMEMKRYDEAAECFEECLLFYKLGTEYHIGAASCYAKLDLPELATYHYREALKIDPDCREALEALKMPVGNKQVN